jgi:hypothetical protein
MNLKTAAVGTGAVLAIALAVWVWRKGAGDVAASLSRGGVKALGGAAAGAVVGIGELVGIPATDKAECQRAFAEGRYLDASFACPASDFLSGVFGSGQPTADKTLILPPPRG